MRLHGCMKIGMDFGMVLLFERKNRNDNFT